MSRTPLFLTVALLSTLGCKTVTKKDYMVDTAGLRAENHRVWHRANEVGFVMGDYIEASSDTSRFLGMFRVGGDPTPSGPSLNIFGGTAGLSSNGEAAVARAIEEAGVDGMYITRVVDEKRIIFPIVKKSATVKGRALTLKDYGPVSEKRADLDRFGYPSDATIEIN